MYRHKVFDCMVCLQLGMEDVRLIKHIEVLTTIASVDKLSSAIMLYKHKTNRIMDTLATSSMKAIPAIFLREYLAGLLFILARQTH